MLTPFLDGCVYHIKHTIYYFEDLFTACDPLSLIKLKHWMPSLEKWAMLKTWYFIYWKKRIEEKICIMVWVDIIINLLPILISIKIIFFLTEDIILHAKFCHCLAFSSLFSFFAYFGQCLEHAQSKHWYITPLAVIIFLLNLKSKSSYEGVGRR